MALCCFQHDTAADLPFDPGLQTPIQKSYMDILLSPERTRNQGEIGDSSSGDGGHVNCLQIQLMIKILMDAHSHTINNYEFQVLL